jgi:hypothetical protein
MTTPHPVRHEAGGIRRRMTMAVATQQSTDNMEYVRRLLQQKEPAFSLVLELALILTDAELTSAERPGDVSAAAGS